MSAAAVASTVTSSGERRTTELSTMAQIKVNANIFCDSENVFVYNLKVWGMCMYVCVCVCVCVKVKENLSFMEKNRGTSILKAAREYILYYI
jgi:hypothetical protein